MTRILVTSDSHGSKGKLLSIVRNHLSDANYFLHLGDCKSGDDITYVENVLEEKIKFISVQGNCDYYYGAPKYDFLEVSKKRILICHGDTFKVKYTLENLFDFAAKNECSIALYGHTHKQYYEHRNGIHILCPGAVMNGEYGIIDISDGNVICINTSI